MKVKIRILGIIATVLSISMLLSCSMDIFNQNKITSITLSGNTASIDIDDDDFITVSAEAVTKSGSTVDANVNWEYDEDVFQEITKTSSSISLELNTDGIGANGRDITGRTVIRATDKSSDGKPSELNSHRSERDCDTEDRYLSESCTELRADW